MGSSYLDHNCSILARERSIWGNSSTAVSRERFAQFHFQILLFPNNQECGWKERVDSQFPSSDLFDLISEPGIDRVQGRLLGAVLWLGVAAISGTLTLTIILFNNWR